MKISVIIPVFNQKDTLYECLLSLVSQGKKAEEIIVVDDGSTDNSSQIVVDLIKQTSVKNVQLIKQKHTGPAIARNIAASKSTGDILVFADSDMTFDTHFLENLIKPIQEKESKGTFTKEEYVKNWDNVWARSWNWNADLPDKKRIPADYPDTAPVFRAILRKEFERVSGFDPIGYTDDWSLSRKLGYKATNASGAICYHNNPETLATIFNKARWIGKNEFIAGSVVRKIVNLVRFAPLFSLIHGIWIALQKKTPSFIFFKIVYDSGISVGIIESWLGKPYYI